MILLLLACLSDDVAEYDLGYEDGCAVGTSAGSSCPPSGDTGIEPEDRNPYSEGFVDGYLDCYAHWSEWTFCG